MDTLKLKTIDLHVGGEPCRVVIDGMPPIEGATMREKQNYIAEHYDFICSSLVCEPRGHKNMFGAILMPPCNKEADYGVVFMYGTGFEDMCGHGTICLCTMLVERGMVDISEPETVIKLDTVAGVVDITVDVKDGEVESVNIANVPSFVYKRDLHVKTPNYGEVSVDMIYSGNPFIMVDAETVGEICPENADAFIKAAYEIRDVVIEESPLIHPELGLLPYANVEFCKGEKNVVMFGEGQIDRSGCGTGTGAWIVMKYDSGEVEMAKPYIHRGILGTELTGMVTREIRAGDITAYDTVIAGKGTIISESTFFVGDYDPLYKGFIL